MSRRSLLLMLAALCLYAATSALSAPNIINYQGSLSDAGGTPLNGNYSLTFRIYGTPIGVPALWSEYHDSVVVTDGRFSVALGSFVVMDDDIYNGDSRYLEIQVGAQILTPRTRLISTPYSFRVESVHGATGGTIDGGVAVRTGLVKTPEDAIKVTDPSGNTVVKVSVDYSSSSTAMSFYDPVDSKSGFAASDSDEHIDYSGASLVPGPELVRIGTEGILVYDTLLDTALNVPTDPTRPMYRTAIGPTVAHFTGDYDGASASDAILKAEYVGPSSSDYDAYAIRGICNQNTSSEFGVGGAFEGGYAGARGRGYYVGLLGAGMDDNGSTIGVQGTTTATNFGSAYGMSATANVTGAASGYGIFATVSGTTTGSKYAGYFSGNVHVSGTLTKSAGSFKIDHPLDPENKYLSHSFVESPDMMNVYNGNITLDSRGEAVVALPEYFEALNKDFRYQLTCIGGYAPIYVAEKVSGSRFKIAGGTPGLEVSWQVTGIRQDAYANTHRIPNEELKPVAERGKYLHPEVFGAGQERGIDVERHKDVSPAATSTAGDEAGR